MVCECKNIDGKEYYFNPYNMMVGSTKDSVKTDQWLEEDARYHPYNWYKNTLINSGSSDINDPSDNLILHLNLNTKCNCCCGYCFRMNGQKLDEGYDVEKAKKIVDIVFTIYKDKIESKRFNISVSVTGEPFYDSDSLWEIIDYIREKCNYNYDCWDFFIITNGTNVSDRDIERIKELNIPVSISIDGTKEVQDKLRPMKNGESSYDHIVDFMKKMTSLTNGDYWFDAEMTVVPLLDEQRDIMSMVEHLKNMGFKKLDFQPIKKNDEYWTDERYNDIIERYIDFYKKLQHQVIFENRFDIFKILIKLNEGLSQIDERFCYSSCGEIRTSQLIIDRNGDVYGCDHFLGNKQYKTNFNIFNFNRMDYVNYKRNRVSERTLDNFSECKECKYRYFCGGKGFICHLYGEKTIKMHCAIQKIKFNALLNIYEYLFRISDYDKKKLDDLFRKYKIANYKYY